MDLGPNGLVTLVTGAAAGLAWPVARLLLGERATSASAGVTRSEDRVRAASDSFEVLGVDADVTVPGDLQRLMTVAIDS
jgi:NAD(P)-dependent dehydrogenase (short-subunit alcohol dehydrogenase family)